MIKLAVASLMVFLCGCGTTITSDNRAFICIGICAATESHKEVSSDGSG